MLTFNFKEKDYKLEPITMGALIDYQKSKAILSDGMYGAMYRMALTETDEALQAIDIEAFLIAFAPNFQKEMKVGVKELGLSDYAELKKLYIDIFKPWLDKNLESLNLNNK